MINETEQYDPSYHLDKIIDHLKILYKNNTLSNEDTTTIYNILCKISFLIEENNGE